MKHFLSFWASYSIAWPRCKKSFVSNNWCLVWTGSAFPQSFLSCKQSDAERKDFVGIPEQGHSFIKAFCFHYYKASSASGQDEPNPAL